MILLPDPEIQIGECAKPNPSWTKALGVPVVNVAIIKFASFARGEASCERRGFSSSFFPGLRWQTFMESRLIFFQTDFPCDYLEF